MEPVQARRQGAGVPAGDAVDSFTGNHPRVRQVLITRIRYLWLRSPTQARERDEVFESRYVSLSRTAGYHAEPDVGPMGLVGALSHAC